ncbi:MAG: c-type cytochrome biogenesis protein CcmI, partial [Rhodanobacteraceae bacterium]
NAQIAMAQARAQGKTQAEAEALARTTASQAAATAVPTAQDAVRNGDVPASVTLKVQVRLDSKLASKMSPSDTLFVFARAIDGPSMPLAVARLPATSLPQTVTLTDAMAIRPQLKLSSFPRVQVYARISKSGDALPHAGDLESQPVQVATAAKQLVVLTIDHVH